MNPEQETHPARIAPLDGLRGLAIGLVLITHFICGGFGHPQNRLDHLLFKLAGAAWCGVDLFFVLSGFLITGILLRTKSDPHYFRNFYMRRTLRIFPLYYGVLLFFFVLLPILRPYRSAVMQTVVAHQGWLWCYASNIGSALNGNVFGSFGHFWSLAIEEHFYLVWPGMVFLFPRKAGIGLCVAAIVGAWICRAYIVINGFYLDAGYVLTPCRMDALAVGCLLALLSSGPDGIDALVRPATRALFFCAACLVILAIYRRGLTHNDPAVLLLGLTPLSLFFGSLLILSIGSPGPGRMSRFFSSTFLRFFGRYSYGIYVFHNIFQPTWVSVFSTQRFQDRLHSYTPAILLHLLLSTTATVLIALISWHAYEKHFLKLKQRFGGAGAE